MHLPSLGLSVALLSTVTAFTPASTYGTDKLQAEGLTNLKSYLKDHTSHDTCNLKHANKRQEWSTLSKHQKKDYINAILCLQSKPAISGDIAPGAKSRYDDFVATHINQTLQIHGTGNFLSWHRYYIHTFETALRDECNFSGHLPYANYGKYAEDLLNSPLFDGSSTSISGNGLFKAHAGASIPSPATPFITVPPGKGGDCITTGPFKNMSVNLGPLSPVFNDTKPNPLPNGLGYNPRCLRRDISSHTASIASTDSNVTDLITHNPLISDFQTVMQGNFAAGLVGIHTAGHFWVGGDPGGDIFASPGDPWFWLHHSQIDRVWWIWQTQDPENRIGAKANNSLGGTVTLNNLPPSRNTTVSDVISLGANAEDIVVGDALSTMEGPFCYVYA